MLRLAGPMSTGRLETESQDQTMQYNPTVDMCRCCSRCKPYGRPNGVGGGVPIGGTSRRGRGDATGFWVGEGIGAATSCPGCAATFLVGSTSVGGKISWTGSPSSFAF